MAAQTDPVVSRRLRALVRKDGGPCCLVAGSRGGQETSPGRFCDFKRAHLH